MPRIAPCWSVSPGAPGPPRPVAREARTGLSRLCPGSRLAGPFPQVRLGRPDPLRVRLERYADRNRLTQRNRIQGDGLDLQGHTDPGHHDWLKLLPPRLPAPTLMLPTLPAPRLNSPTLAKPRFTDLDDLGITADFGRPEPGFRGGSPWDLRHAGCRSRRPGHHRRLRPPRARISRRIAVGSSSRGLSIPNSVVDVA